MRILYVTTWGSTCGIATYTEELVEGSKDLWDSCVASPAEGGSGIRETPAVPARQYWQRSSPLLEQSLLQAVEDFLPDIVHVQHEHGLFQLPTVFVRAVRTLNRRRPVIVTLHTMNWAGTWEHTLWLKDVGQCIDRIVVHSPEALASASLFAPNTVCIPHGTGPTVVGSKERGVELLRAPPHMARLLLSDKSPPVCLLHGFIGPGKNLLCTIRALAMAEARRLCEPVFIAITGQADETFLRQLQWMLGVSGLELRTVVNPTFVTVKDVPHVMAIADFGVLNTTSWNLSASGAAHVYARNNVPIAVANRPIYYEAVRAGVPTFDLASAADSPTDAMIDIVAALINNRELRRQVKVGLQDWAAKTQWSVLAKQYHALYTQVLAEREVLPEMPATESPT